MLCALPRFSFLEWLIFLLFLLMFVFGLLMFLGFYICDSGNCKAYTVANAKLTEQERYISLLNEVGNDGIWPIAFIGGTFIAILFTWWFKIPFNLRNFVVLFFLPFCIIYFLFSFVFHHYVKPITHDVRNYLLLQNSA